MPVDAEARIIAVRDNIVSDIVTNIAKLDSDANAIAQRFDVSSDYIDDYQLENMKLVRVNVKIVGDTTEASDRTPASEDTYQFEISVQQSCRQQDTEKLDLLLNLAKRISKRYYPNKQLSLANPVVCVTNETELYNYVCLRDHKHFHSRINLTFREFVDD